MKDVAEYEKHQIVKEISGCCRVVLHHNPNYPGDDAIYIRLTEKFKDSPRLGYNCMIRAIGDALLESGVDINAL